MSNTSETVQRRVRDAHDTIDLVADRMAVSVEPAEAEAAVSFTRVFLGRAPEDLLRRRDLDDLVGMTLGAWRFLRSSRADRVDVAIHDPATFDEGWTPAGTVLRTNVSERPFIIGTIREFLHGQDLALEWMIYPILDVTRDEDQRVIAVGPATDTGTKESVVHCEIERVTDPERLAWL